jgi:hypothetical protein
LIDFGATIEISPRKGGSAGERDQIRVNQIKTQQPQSTINETQKITNLSTPTVYQSKFSTSPLMIEGVRLNKLQLNDMLKQHLNYIEVYDVQLVRSGTFTTDVPRMLTHSIGY